MERIRQDEALRLSVKRTRKAFSCIECRRERKRWDSDGGKMEEKAVDER